MAVWSLTLVLSAACCSVAGAGCPFGFDSGAAGGRVTPRGNAFAPGRTLLLAEPPPAGGGGAAEPARAASRSEEEEEEEESGPPVNGHYAVNIDLGSSAQANTILGAVGGVPINATDYFVMGPLNPKALLGVKRTPLQQRGWVPVNFSSPSTCSNEEFDAIAKMIGWADLKLEHPGALRLGWHTCATYNSIDGSGGCNGAWLRFGPDRDAVGNAGLAAHMDVLEKVKRAHPCITYADLYTFAASVAAELSGGPPIAWLPGRVDGAAPGPANPPVSSRLPDGGFNAAAMAYFFTQLGLNARESVALYGGGHSIGTASTPNSGWSLVWATGDVWPTLRNRFFVDLIEREWEQQEAPDTGLPQWVLAASEPLAGEAGEFEEKPIGRLPSDMALLFSKVYLPHVRHYAANETAFMRDFSLVAQKMLCFGSPGVGAAKGGYHWKGLKGDWPGWGRDAAYMSLVSPALPPAPRLGRATQLSAVAAAGADSGSRTLTSAGAACLEKFNALIKSNYDGDSTCAGLITTAMSSAAANPAQCPPGSDKPASDVQRCMSKTPEVVQAWIAFIKGCEVLNVADRNGAAEAEAAAQRKPSCFPAFGSIAELEAYMHGQASTSTATAVAPWRLLSSAVAVAAALAAL